eukprot:235018_1
MMGSAMFQSNSWKCSSCGLQNKNNRNKCSRCFVFNDKIIWCWEDNNRSYVPYPNSISEELSKLKIGKIYSMKIQKITYKIKKISNTKCSQINTKTKHVRSVIQQNTQSLIHTLASQDDVKIESSICDAINPPLHGQTQRVGEQKDEQKQSNESIASQLVAMGFEQQYINRAVDVYKDNYGHNHMVSRIAEIIIRLQNKEHIIQNKKNKKHIQNNSFMVYPQEGSVNRPAYNNKNLSHNNVPILPQFNAMESNHSKIKTNCASVLPMFDDVDCKMKNAVNKKQAIHEWTERQLINWVNHLNVIPIKSRNKIINGIREYNINASDFYLCENGQEVAETFDIDIMIGNFVYSQMQKTASNVYHIEAKNVDELIFNETCVKEYSEEKKKDCKFSKLNVLEAVASVEEILSDYDTIKLKFHFEALKSIKRSLKQNNKDLSKTKYLKIASKILFNILCKSHMAMNAQCLKNINLDSKSLKEKAQNIALRCIEMQINEGKLHVELQKDAVDKVLLYSIECLKICLKIVVS